MNDRDQHLESAPGGVRTVNDKAELAQIVDPKVTAVILAPSATPGWLAEVVDALETGDLSIPRTTLDGVTVEEFSKWLGEELASASLSAEAGDALLADLLAVPRAAADLSGSRRLIVRILTAEPTTDCGFHVDTTRPGVAPWGLLKTYNGPGTSYVDPANVTSMSDFYRYLSRRERLEREDGDVEELDIDPGFLHYPAGIDVAGACSMIAFKHLDVSTMWSEQDPARAWIHCSPMAGKPRLVINATGCDPQPRGRPGAGANAR